MGLHVIRRADVVVTWWPLAVLGAVAALSVAAGLHPGPWPGEVGWVRWLQDLREPVGSVADFVRLTTGTEGNLIVLVPLAVVVVARHGRPGAVVVAFALVAMLGVQPGLKDVVDRPRPDETQVEVRADHTSESFPSGHSLSTTTVWGSAALVAWRASRRRLAALLAAPIALTAMSSGVQGVHWPSDAVAGTLIGLLAVAVAAVLLSPPDPPDTATTAGRAPARGPRRAG